jgi:hypothetical protein
MTQVVSGANGSKCRLKEMLKWWMTCLGPVWMKWRAPVHYVVDDMASFGRLCGGRRGEPVHHAVDDATSTDAPCGG